MLRQLPLYQTSNHLQEFGDPACFSLLSVSPVAVHEGGSGCIVGVGAWVDLAAPDTLPGKRRFLLETTIFKGYVSFRECNHQVQ